MTSLCSAAIMSNDQFSMPNAQFPPPGTNDLLTNRIDLRIEVLRFRMDPQPGHGFAHSNREGLAALKLWHKPLNFRAIKYARVRRVSLEGAGHLRRHLADEFGGNRNDVR